VTRTMTLPLILDPGAWWGADLYAPSHSHWNRLNPLSCALCRVGQPSWRPWDRRHGGRADGGEWLHFHHSETTWFAHAALSDSPSEGMGL